MDQKPSRPILKLHAAGRWTPEQVEIERIASTWRSTAEIDAMIESSWKEATARLGSHLFDGKMCRLENWDASEERLKLTLSQTRYRHFLGTNLAHPELEDQFGREVLANPVGVSPALLSCDGFLMMGRRNRTVAYYPQKIHPFAGALDPDDANPFAAIGRELSEELSFTPADVTEIFCTGIAEDLSIRQPELIFFARSRRSRAEVERALDRKEHDATWAAPATVEGIEAAMKSEEPFTPVAVAAMLLYGRVAFGEGFFVRNAADRVAID